jgi:hypothetical protein
VFIRDRLTELKDDNLRNGSQIRAETKTNVENEISAALNLIQAISQAHPPEGISKLVGLKVFYIEISMLAWASYSIYLNLHPLHSGDTFLSLKFAVFFIFGALTISQLIGYITFVFFWKSISQGIDKKIHFIFWIKRFWAALNFIMTCAIADLLFEAIFGRLGHF